jgi:endonuclease-3 related protein
MQETVRQIYGLLYVHFGPQHWWPGDTPFEVIVGAILTQNTAWTNVEKAMENLRREGLLDPESLHRAREIDVARLIRPSGYFNLKAKKLKAFVRFLYDHHHGRLSYLFKTAAEPLREELLGVYGIGPETADSIVLYAANKPIFVVDAYTRRIAARLGLAGEDASYDELQRLFMAHLPRDSELFNEYHALLVALGKHFCLKTTPRCMSCPVRPACAYGQASARREASAWRHGRQIQDGRAG